MLACTKFMRLTFKTNRNAYYYNLHTSFLKDSPKCDHPRFFDESSRSLATKIASWISTSKYKRCNNFDLRKTQTKEMMEWRMDSATLGYELTGYGLTTLERTFIASEWWCASEIIRQLIKHLSNTTYWLTNSSTHLVHCIHFEIQQFEFTLAFWLCANIFLNLIM